MNDTYKNALKLLSLPIFAPNSWNIQLSMKFNADNTLKIPKSINKIYAFFVRACIASENFWNPESHQHCWVSQYFFLNGSSWMSWFKYRYSNLIVRKKLAAIDGFQGDKKWKNKNEGRKMRTYFFSVLIYNPVFFRDCWLL